jgi:uncharacterized protein YggE
MEISMMEIATMEIAATEIPAMRPRLSASQLLLTSAALVAAALLATGPARAQQQAPASTDGQVIVSGEGSVSVPPDQAQIRGGVTTRAKTAKEATDANSKLMTAVTAALIESGIAPKNIQTSHFSLTPVYSQDPHAEPKLTGYSVSNQVSVTIRQIDKVGDVIDRVIAAGATDVGSIVFQVSDTSKALDQAREAAVADAQRKAALYAHASGVTLGHVAWIAEDSASVPERPVMAKMFSAGAPPVPIASGEDTLHVRITVGFEIAH